MSDLNSIGGISAECSGSVHHEYLTSALAARLLPRVPGISAPAPSPRTSPCPPRRASPAEAWAPANTITKPSPALCPAPTIDRPRNHLRLLPEHQQLTLNPGMKVGVGVNNVSTFQTRQWCGEIVALFKYFYLQAMDLSRHWQVWATSPPPHLYQRRKRT